QALAQIEYYASQKDYEKVLTTAASVKGLKPAAEIRLQLALYHSGRLCQDLFSFTNQANWRLLPSLGGGLDASRAQSQTLLELGQVSEAEHLAHEALEWEGERPETLRLLAQINILKDRPQAARVFLNVLRQVPTQRQWAENYLRQLAANPRLPEDKELALIRTRLVKTDLPHVDIPVETFMRQLLHSNPRNQMALEYLMAHYLVSLEMGKLVERLKDLDAFGYTTLPRHLEEAILLHQQIKHVQVDLCGHPIRPETLQRFQQWSEAIRQGAFMSPQGRAELARDFGDTYWYYFLARQGANNPSNS
ncbi:MAG TPA: DUF6057 family protein, partial [Bacillota bacterium]|nr:DUF6057 family protein [Bacillota bacterium]